MNQLKALYIKHLEKKVQKKYCKRTFLYNKKYAFRSDGKVIRRNGIKVCSKQKVCSSLIYFLKETCECTVTVVESTEVKSKDPNPAQT